MIFIAILIGCILGALIGMNVPMISYTYSSYLAIAIIAALDSVFGGITSVINKNVDLKIFVTGFLDFKTYKKIAEELAWETKVWIDEMPEHMINLNGDRFMGPR